MGGKAGPTASDFIGMEAVAAYTEIVRLHPRIQSLRIASYRNPPRLQQRLKVGTSEQELIRTALEIKNNVGVPFWEALCVACLRCSEVSESVLDAILLHLGAGEEKELTRADVLSGGLSREAKWSRRHGGVGLLSAVDLDCGERLHLSFLDFHCEVSEANARLASRISERLFPEGYLILDSGDSFHAAGIELMTAEERVHRLGRALLFSPIVDANYIAHQLMQESSSIRISLGGRRQYPPTVVAAYLDGG